VSTGGELTGRAAGVDQKPEGLIAVGGVARDAAPPVAARYNMIKSRQRNDVVIDVAWPRSRRTFQRRL
jgi:hypothetical protein